MANVTGQVVASASFTETVTSGLITPQSLPVNMTQSLGYSSGTGMGQVNLAYAKRLTFAAAPQTLDLSSLLDLSGASVNFARVRELIVANNATAAGAVLTVGAASGSPFTGFLDSAGLQTVYPATATSASTFASATWLRWSDPCSTGSATGAITGSANKMLKLDPGANSFTADVLILGCDSA